MALLPFCLPLRILVHIVLISQPSLIMTKKRRKRKSTLTGEEVTVVCHHCKQEFAGNLHRSGKVTSQAFSKHIFHPANESCKDHCEKHKLMSATKGDWQKLRKCLTLESA